MSRRELLLAGSAAAGLSQLQLSGAADAKVVSKDWQQVSLHLLGTLAHPKYVARSEDAAWHLASLDSSRERHQAQCGLVGHKVHPTQENPMPAAGEAAT